jgi:hypothetical protein
MLKACLEIGAALVTLIGVVIGVYGTYVLTMWTHPMGFWAFNQSVLIMFARKIVGKDDMTARVNRVATKLAEMKPENKAESLHGLHWIFLGFVLQTIGALLLAIDAVCVNFFLDPSH